jgi:hypothetical protein
MGAPIGNKNAAGPHRMTGKYRGKSSSKYYGGIRRSFYKIQQPRSRYGKRVGTPASGYSYKTPADWYRY